MKEIYYLYGSKSPNEVNVLVITENLSHLGVNELESICLNFEKELSKEYLKKLFINLASIDRKVLSWCFKDSVDEVNNNLLSTYNLHHQKYNLLISNRLKRDLELKILYFVNSFLYSLKDSEFKEEVRVALKSDIHYKLKILEYIKISTTKDIVNSKEHIKDIAFKIGQIIGLYQNKELYTEEDIIKFLPALKPFLHKQDVVDLILLDQLKDLLSKTFERRKWKRIN